MSLENKPIELTEEHLLQIFGSNASNWFEHISSAAKERSINTTYRLAAWLGNIGHETGMLTRLEENLNYSALRLVEVFPKYFVSVEAAAPFERNPEKIANRVYGGRLGNGDESTGDGFTYRGRGLIQLTGKSNYEHCTKGGVVCLGPDADYLTSKEGAAKSAAWYWASKGLNEMADRADFNGLVKRINSGLLGLEERTKIYQIALRVLCQLAPDTPIQTDPTADPVEGVDGVKPDSSAEPEDTPTPSANHPTITEPTSPGKPQYPWNQVLESRAGHLIEIDDTPGSERLHWYHKTGTYVEMFADGKYVLKSTGDRYDLANKNRFHQTTGDYTAKIGGQYFQKVGGDKVTSVGKTYVVEAPTCIQLNTPVVYVQNNLIGKGILGESVDVKGGVAGKLADLKAAQAKLADYALRAGKLGPPIITPSRTGLTDNGPPAVPNMPTNGDLSPATGNGTPYVYTPTPPPDAAQVAFKDEGSYRVSVGGNATQLIDGSSSTRVDNNVSTEVGADISTRAGGNVFTEAAQSLVIKAPVVAIKGAVSPINLQTSGVLPPAVAGLNALHADGSNAPCFSTVTGGVWDTKKLVLDDGISAYVAYTVPSNAAVIPITSKVIMLSGSRTGCTLANGAFLGQKVTLCGNSASTVSLAGGAAVWTNTAASPTYGNSIGQVAVSEFVWTSGGWFEMSRNTRV